ncbi:A-factor receptor protein [Streptomyces sp. YIM 130001]|nr:A-factor receptor protein [Streptomyces sp. YIM 130001]
MASCLGISKGALYFHFPSKQALATAVAARQHDLVPRLIARLRPRHEKATEVLVALAGQVTWQLMHRPDVHAGLRLIAEDQLVGHNRPARTEDFVHPYSAWAGAIDELLREAGGQGDIRPGIDTSAAARSIMCAFAGLRQVLPEACRVRPHESGTWAAAPRQFLQSLLLVREIGTVEDVGVD